MGRTEMEKMMAEPTATGHDAQEIDEFRVARSVAVWIGKITPVAVIAVTLALWLVLDVTIGKAFAIGAWPAVLVGVFGGGFVGIVRGAH